MQIPKRKSYFRIVRKFKFCWCVIVTMALVGAGLAGNAAGKERLREQWMTISMQGKRIGYAHMKVVKKQEDGKKLYVSHTTQEFTVKRGATELHLKIRQKVTEDESGQVLKFERTTKQGAVNQTMKGFLQDGKWIIVTGEKPNEVRQSVDPPDVLGPWAVEQVSRARGYESGTEYTLPIFMGDAPTQKVTATVTVGPEEARQIGEVKKWLHKVKVQLSIMPGMKNVEWVDDSGQVWLTKSVMGPLTLQMRRTSKTMAMREPEAAEIMLDTAITPGRRIDRPREVSEMRVTFVPRQKNGSEDVDRAEVAESSWQKTQKQGDNLMVEIQKPAIGNQETYSLPYSGKDMAHYLQETPWLETNREILKTMSEEAVGQATSALGAARNIERYVSDIISDKNLGTGFATAAETARQKAGDCTEHALLAAALARVAGIPSRVVCGLAYGGPLPGDNQPRFYFHMWTEVYVGRWFPIDPALGTFDATHIGIVRSDLFRPDSVTEISSAVMMFPGRFDIKVEQTKH